MKYWLNLNILLATLQVIKKNFKENDVYHEKPIPEVSLLTRF